MSGRLVMRLLGGAVLGLLGLSLVGLAVGLWATAGLTGELRTPAESFDADACEIAILDVDGVTISPPSGPVGQLVALTGHVSRVVVKTRGEVVKVADPRVDLIGVDYCRVSRVDEQWEVLPVVARGRPLQGVEPLPRMDPETVALSPATLVSDLAIIGSPVGRVQILATMDIGDTAPMIFAFAAAGAAALVGAVLCLVLGRDHGRHEVGGGP